MIGKILKDTLIYEAKMARSRTLHHIGTHKIPYIGKNGLMAELVYSSRFIPGYIAERVSANKNLFKLLF